MELILNTFGTSLNRKGNAFIVSCNGESKQIPACNIESIQINKGISVTSDAMMLALEQEIDVLLVDRSGMPIGRMWSPRYGSISSIRKGQLHFAYSEDALKWIKGIIDEKIANQQALLLLMQTDDIAIMRIRERNINRLEDYRKKVINIPNGNVSDHASQLRGWEGMASKIYFATLNEFIPQEYRFPVRSQHPARDVVNAMLNYGYGILYGKVEAALIKSGIDPYVGVLHRDNYKRPVLVFDVIERYRIWVDYVVYSLVNQQAVTDDFSTVNPDGSCWLDTFGRRVLIQSLNDYLNETVDINGLSRSRLTHIQLYAQHFAQNLKKYQ